MTANVNLYKSLCICAEDQRETQCQYTPVHLPYTSGDIYAVPGMMQLFSLGAFAG